MVTIRRQVDEQVGRAKPVKKTLEIALKSSNALKASNTELEESFTGIATMLHEGEYLEPSDEIEVSLKVINDCASHEKKIKEQLKKSKEVLDDASKLLEAPENATLPKYLRHLQGKTSPSLEVLEGVQVNIKSVIQDVQERDISKEENQAIFRMARDSLNAILPFKFSKSKKKELIQRKRKLPTVVGIRVRAVSYERDRVAHARTITALKFLYDLIEYFKECAFQTYEEVTQNLTVLKKKSETLQEAGNFALRISNAHTPEILNRYFTLDKDETTLINSLRGLELDATANVADLEQGVNALVEDIHQLHDPFIGSTRDLIFEVQRMKDAQDPEFQGDLPDHVEHAQNFSLDVQRRVQEFLDAVNHWVGDQDTAGVLEARSLVEAFARDSVERMAYMICYEYMKRGFVCRGGAVHFQKVNSTANRALLNALGLGGTAFVAAGGTNLAAALTTVAATTSIALVPAFWVGVAFISVGGVVVAVTCLAANDQVRDSVRGFFCLNETQQERALRRAAYSFWLIEFGPTPIHF